MIAAESRSQAVDTWLENLRTSLLALTEIGGNRLLEFDPESLAACAQMQGHCIMIEITDLDFKLYCYPGAWGVRLSGETPKNKVDATVSGRLMALVNLAMQRDKLSTSIQERVSFHGDVELAQKMQKLLTGLDIDWEELLAKQTGDLVAYQIHQQAKGFQRWFQSSAESLLQTTSEYLREEAGLSPTQIEFETFQAELTELKHDVARSEARLQALLDQSAQAND